MKRMRAKAVVADDLDENFEHHQALTVEQKWAIVCECLHHFDHNTLKLENGTRDIIAKKFDISTRTVTKLLAEYKNQRSSGVLYPTMMPKYHGRV